ncbi:MAG TPA: hypothetical protein VF623_04405, partial [Segetibacter sp.]
MKQITVLAMLAGAVAACNSPKVKQQPEMEGTWKLLEGTLIEKGDTAITDYTKGVSFIKIINETHFAFLQHDLTKGKDSVP